VWRKHYPQLIVDKKISVLLEIHHQILALAEQTFRVNKIIVFIEDSLVRKEQHTKIIRSQI